MDLKCFKFTRDIIMVFADLVFCEGTFPKGVTINFKNLHPTREAQRLSCLERSFKWGYSHDFGCFLSLL